jgi:hypothetical protein
MPTNLEKCGNLAVPVDESGTATGRPEPYQDKTMETKHTKGPWEANILKRPDGTFQGTPYIYAPDSEDGGRFVGEVFTTPECEANARLIACAPELLDVAELVVWMFSGETERSGHLDGLIKQAEAAIAKAKGNKT